MRKDEEGAVSAVRNPDRRLASDWGQMELLWVEDTMTLTFSLRLPSLFTISLFVSRFSILSFASVFCTLSILLLSNSYLVLLVLVHVACSFTYFVTPALD